MSYKTYTTEAIVCGSRVNNTSDKSYLLFTRDAGMLWASAKSVREERSRQRYALQDFTLIKVSLVRGKSGWRIGSAEGEVNYFTAAQSQAARASVSGVIKLLRQFVRGEVAHEAAFKDAKSALELSGQLPGSEVAKLKDLFGFRLLYHLGYIPPLEEYGPILNDIDWWELPELSVRARKALDKAEEVSHL
jgi:recombinational DNA repair protein (RecF pathway)